MVDLKFLTVGIFEGELVGFPVGGGVETLGASVGELVGCFVGCNDDVSV